MKDHIARDCLSLLIIGLIIIAFIALSFCGGLLVDEGVAIKTLETQGFSNIQIVDRDWLFIPFRGGAPTDNVRFEAVATNPAGKVVTVYVYAGWPFKAGTIRAR